MSGREKTLYSKPYLHTRLLSEHGQALYVDNGIALSQESGVRYYRIHRDSGSCLCRIEAHCVSRTGKP